MAMFTGEVGDKVFSAKKVVEHATIFARVSPSHKRIIVQAYPRGLHQIFMSVVFGYDVFVPHVVHRI